METVRNIQNPIPPVVLQPSKWLSLYEDFVAKNSSSVGSVESALRSLTYIIPGKIGLGDIYKWLIADRLSTIV